MVTLETSLFVDLIDLRDFRHRGTGLLRFLDSFITLLDQLMIPDGVVAIFAIHNGIRSFLNFTLQLILSGFSQIVSILCSC